MSKSLPRKSVNTYPVRWREHWMLCDICLLVDFVRKAHELLICRNFIYLAVVKIIVWMFSKSSKDSFSTSFCVDVKILWHFSRHFCLLKGKILVLKNLFLNIITVIPVFPSLQKSVWKQFMSFHVGASFSCQSMVRCNKQQ